MIFLRQRRFDLLVALGLVLAALAPGEARGQQPEARMKRLNKLAMDQYDSLEFDAASRGLQEALSVARKAEITSGAVLVQTYLNLGIVYGAGLNDRATAVKHFASALRLDPDAVLSPARATPVLEEIFQEARESTVPVAKPPTAAKAIFEHTSVQEARSGRPLRIRAQVTQEGLSRVMLFYRPRGSFEFRAVRMRMTRPGSYLGVLPADVVRGRSLDYYIEAQDETGERIHGHGTAISPNLVELIGEERPRPQAKDRGPWHSMFSIGVLVGVGGGVVAGGKSEHEQEQMPPPKTATVEIEAGGALAPFHIAPELNYHIDENWQIGVLGRIQLLNLTDRGSTKVSLLGEARAKRYFGTGDLRFYFAFGAGVGEIRHRIPLGDYDTTADDNASDPTPDNIKDTRVARLAAFGVGSGLCWMFSRHVGLVAELNGLFVVPQFAANLDLNTGLQVSF